MKELQYRGYWYALVDGVGEIVALTAKVDMITLLQKEYQSSTIYYVEVKPEGVCLTGKREVR